MDYKGEITSVIIWLPGALPIHNPKADKGDLDQNLGFSSYKLVMVLVPFEIKLLCFRLVRYLCPQSFLQHSNTEHLVIIL